MRLPALSLILTMAFSIAGTSEGAQETTGSIQGRIVDQQALPVPGVSVVATGPQGAKEATTDDDGRFTIPFLTPGAYGVRAELQGFKAIEQNDINVSLGQTVDLPLRLEVGGTTETVNVRGVIAPIDTTNATTGAIIDSDLYARCRLGDESATSHTSCPA